MTQPMTEDELHQLADRLRRRHPLQYGYIGGLKIVHTEESTDPRLTDRMNRCPVCQEWSPCDVRRAADFIAGLTLEVDS